MALHATHGGYLEKTAHWDSNIDSVARHPHQTDEIEPLTDGIMSAWSGEINAIPIYIYGSKTDWLNQGMARSHNLIPEGVPNSRLFPARSLIKLWKISPAKFHRNNERVFASWRSGKSIKTDRVWALLRMAVFEHGLCPAAFSLSFSLSLSLSISCAQVAQQRYIAQQET